MLNRFKYAFEGVFYLLKKDKNFRLHLFFFSLVLIASIYFQISKIEFLLVLICSGIVLSLEIVNSVIEEVADYIQPNKDIRIKNIKDAAAAAVLIFSLFSLLVAAIIFLPKIWTMFFE